jgi:rubrerythrin
MKLSDLVFQVVEAVISELPVSKYRCQKCLFYFEHEFPGPTECPKCGHLYVDWLNSKAVLEVARKIDNKEKK